MTRTLWSLIVLLLLAGGATDAAAASVTLAWDGEAGLRYRVFYGTEPGVYTRSVDAKEQHSIVITGLADDRVYYFAVRSYNEAGQMSDVSAEVCNAPAQEPRGDRPDAGPSNTVQVPSAVPSPPAASDRDAARHAPPAVPGSVPAPPAYVIGPSDVLIVAFWRDKEMSAEVIVRPDGNITLPLLNDIQAAGLTPSQLRDRIFAEAERYVENPSLTVALKEINSRKVFITGQVEKPGPYPLTGPTTVLQLIAMAGGLKEFADGKNIVVMRTENGRPVSYPFDYHDLLKRRNLRQNIELKPGDTVVVP